MATGVEERAEQPEVTWLWIKIHPTEEGVGMIIMVAVKKNDK
jgi:hypothetical protein